VGTQIKFASGTPDGPRSFVIPPVQGTVKLIGRHGGTIDQARANLADARLTPAILPGVAPTVESAAIVASYASRLTYADIVEPKNFTAIFCMESVNNDFASAGARAGGIGTYNQVNGWGVFPGTSTAMRLRMDFLTGAGSAQQSLQGTLSMAAGDHLIPKIYAVTAFDGAGAVNSVGTLYDLTRAATPVTITDGHARPDAPSGTRGLNIGGTDSAQQGPGRYRYIDFFDRVLTPTEITACALQMAKYLSAKNIKGGYVSSVWVPLLPGLNTGP
jgi:hypothetical protein